MRSEWYSAIKNVKKITSRIIMMSLLSIIVFWVDVEPFTLFSSSICVNASETYDDIKLSEDKVFMEVGDSFEISLKNATECDVTWNSKNKSIASITKKGKIKAKKVGKTKITATYLGQKYKCTVTVVVKGKGYKLNKSKLSLKTGHTYELKLNSVEPLKVTWKSANKAIASVSNKGLITAKKKGKTVITATYKHKKYACSITVAKAKWDPSDKSDLQIEPNNDYITTKETIVKTAYGDIIIDPNVYVVGDLKERFEKICRAIESEANLTYSGGKNSGALKLHVKKEVIYPAANPQSELSGSAFCAGTDVYISSGDLFVAKSYAIIHELSHALEHSYHDWYLNQTLSEGFAQYTAYKVLKKLCSTDMKDASSLAHYQDVINDNPIKPASSIYTQTFEYWMENQFPTTYSFNGSYATGFRFMAYLDAKYGNYCNHIKRTQEMLGNPPATSNSADINQVKTLLATTYSNDVIDGFYPWLRSNESFFATKDTFNYDYSNTSRPIVLFPTFGATNSTFLGANTDSKITYNNLVVDISKAVTYLRDYKHIDVSSLVLQVDVTAKVTLYDANGKYIGSSYGQTEIPVTGVAYVKLNSTGQTLFRLKGYTEYHP